MLMTGSTSMRLMHWSVWDVTCGYIWYMLLGMNVMRAVPIDGYACNAVACRASVFSCVEVSHRSQRTSLSLSLSTRALPGLPAMLLLLLLQSTIVAVCWRGKQDARAHTHARAQRGCSQYLLRGVKAKSWDADNGQLLTFEKIAAPKVKPVRRWGYAKVWYSADGR